jgi:hypothetical protein
MNNNYKVDRAEAEGKPIGDYRQRVKLYAIFNTAQVPDEAGI